MEPGPRFESDTRARIAIVRATRLAARSQPQRRPFLSYPYWYSRFSMGGSAQEILWSAADEDIRLRRGLALDF